MHSPAVAADPLRLLDDPVEQSAFTRVVEGTAESALRLEGLHCAACIPTIEAALRAVPGVIDVRASAAAASATVRWDTARTSPSALVKAVRAAGYDAVPDTEAAARLLRRAESRRIAWRAFVAAFCSMQVMMLATPSYFGTEAGLTPDMKRLLDWGAWLMTLPVLLFSARPFFSGAWRSLRTRTMGMDVPVALGIVVAFVASTGAAFDPGGVFGHEVYFDSLTMFIAFLLVGRWLETGARHRAAERLEAASAGLPLHAQRVLNDGSTETIAARRLQPGDRVRVATGEVFPADGLLLQGNTSADEAWLSGESRPVTKNEGDPLVAGSINLGAPVEMRVDRVGADTRHEAILALMREAATQRPALVQEADRWAGPFVWTVLLLAAGAAAVWSVVDPSRAIWVAVSVLVVTCPCALSLAVPSALLAAAGRSARDGLLLRRLGALETLARIDTLFIDKTGTLTERRLVVERVHAMDAACGNAAHIAASLGAWSSHPVSQALAAASEPAAIAWREVQEQPGQGIAALDEQGRCWRLGRPSWVCADGPAEEGVWLACDGRAIASFELSEQLRDGAAQAAHELQADGVQLTLLSGDSQPRTARLAERLKLDRWIGGLSPEQKLQTLQRAQSQGQRVAMVGDGVNDAPVLAQADVSIAMGEGAPVARAQADAVLLRNSLQDLAKARQLARRTMRVIRQNLAWSALYNAACVPLALAGYLPPWAAGLGMAASSLLVVLNSLRLSWTSSTS